MTVFLQEHYVISGSIIFSGFFMCYALTKSTIVVYDVRVRQEHLFLYLFSLYQWGQQNISLHFFQRKIKRKFYEKWSCRTRVSDMWINYEDFTRSRRTNAISQVNGIASEYVRRLDDDPPLQSYREKDSARSSVVSHAPTSTDMNLVSSMINFIFY